MVNAQDIPSYVNVQSGIVVSIPKKVEAEALKFPFFEGRRRHFREYFSDR